MPRRSRWLRSGPWWRRCCCSPTRWPATSSRRGPGNPQGGAPDNRELERTRRRLGAVEAVLGDARADAGAVAGALAAAVVAVEAATDDEDRQERRLAEQVRGA
jgi:hypothetical protein